MSPAERSLRARIGALRVHAAGKTNTGPARQAFAARFYADVPEDLPQAERDRRADYARRAYMAGLSLKASKARAAR